MCVSYVFVCICVCNFQVKQIITYYNFNRKLNFQDNFHVFSFIKIYKSSPFGGQINNMGVFA